MKNSSPDVFSCQSQEGETSVMPVSFLSRDSKNFLLEPHSIGHMWLMPGDLRWRILKFWAQFMSTLNQSSINPYSVYNEFGKVKKFQTSRPLFSLEKKLHEKSVGKFIVSHSTNEINKQEIFHRLGLICWGRELGFL